MTQYFTTKVSYKKDDEKTGKIKKVTESFLVNSLSVTEAENRILNWLPSNYKEQDVVGANKSTVIDIFKHGDSEKWFLARIADPIEDDKGNIKKTYFYVLVNGDDIIAAGKNIKENFKGSVSDYDINSLVSTNIIVDEELISEPTRDGEYTINENDSLV